MSKKKKTRAISKTHQTPAGRERRYDYTDGIIRFLNKWGLIILTVFVLLYVAQYSYISHKKYETFSYYDFDLAIFNQVTWNTLHGNFMYSTIRENVYNINGIRKPVGIFFKDHFSVILVFLTPIYALHQSPITLLVLQTLFLAGAAIPLYLLTRRLLHGGWALAFALAYLLYPPVGYINLFEFHPLCFVPFFLLFGFYFYLREKFWPFVVFLALAMFCKEEISITIFMFGIYALINGLRKKNIAVRKRWAITPAAMGLGWAVLTYGILSPGLNPQGYVFTQLFGEMGGSLGGIIKTTIAHPIHTLKVILKRAPEYGINKPLFLLQLFLPLLFLSLLSPLMLMVIIPQLFLYLASTKPTSSMIYFQYTGTVIPILFISAVMGVAYLDRKIRWRHYWPAPAGVLLAVSFICSLVWGSQFKLFSKDWNYVGANTTGSYNKLYLSDYRNDIRQRMVDLIPKDASVVSTFRLLDKLSSRRYVYSFHYFYIGKEIPTRIDYALPRNVDYVLLDYSDPLFKGSSDPSTSERMQAFFIDRKYGVEKVIDSIVLFEQDGDDLTPLFEELDEMPRLANMLMAPVMFRLDQQKSVQFIALIGREASLIETDGFKQIEVTAYWQCLNPNPQITLQSPDGKGRPADMNIDVVIQLLTPAESLQDQQKTPPVVSRRYPITYELHPAPEWRKDEIVKTAYRMALPPDIEPGEYELRMSPVPKDRGLFGAWAPARIEPVKIVIGGESNEGTSDTDD